MDRLSVVMNSNDRSYNMGPTVDPNNAGMGTYLHKDQLRKGKWTPEEERYANKVIEYFNAGTLKLDDEDRGITLRAYLSQKLGCDPMRITKKYTGAACLGKRVYHAYRQNGKSEEMERNSIELQILEHEFRAKLAQMSRRRPPDSYNNTASLVTTPGIDALFKNNPLPQGWAGSMGPGHGGYYPNGGAPGGNFVVQYPPVGQDPGNGGGNGVPPQPPGSTGLPQDPSRYAFYPAPNPHAGTVAPPPAPAHVPVHVPHVPHEGMNGSMPYPATAADRGNNAAEVPVEADGAEAKRLRVSNDGESHEHDNEVASSLLGFFTQLERHTSQEDMVHFFEGVQKNAVAATAKSPGKPSPHPSNAPNGAASMPQDRMSAGMGTGMLTGMATGMGSGMATGAGSGLEPPLAMSAASIPVGSFHTSPSSRSLP